MYVEDKTLLIIYLKLLDKSFIFVYILLVFIYLILISSFVEFIQCV